MQNDFVNLVDSLYGDTTDKNQDPVLANPILPGNHILPGNPVLSASSVIMQSPISSSQNTFKYVMLGIMFLVFIYLVLKVLNQAPNHTVSGSPIVPVVPVVPIVPKIEQQQKRQEEDPYIEKPWTLSWASEPETFTVTGQLPYYDKEEDERQKISADGNDNNLENYIKQREDFSKTLERNKDAL